MLNAQFVTDFADQAVLLPLAGCLAVLFRMVGWRRGAIAWTGAIGATLASMFVLKVVTLAFGWRWIPADILSSPSGHTAAAAAIYGGLLAVVVQRLTGRPGHTAAWSFLVASAIGSSRLLLQVHSGLEVLIGGGIGMAGASSFTALAGHVPVRLDVRHIAMVTLFAFVLFHGVHMPAEAAIRMTAAHLRSLTER